jgi:hypothetical protein
MLAVSGGLIDRGFLADACDRLGLTTQWAAACQP